MEWTLLIENISGHVRFSALHLHGCQWQPNETKHFCSMRGSQVASQAKVGQLESDPEDGYVSAGITAGGESLLRTLGRIGGDTTSGDRCSVTLRVNVSFVEGSDGGTAIDCAATAFGIGGWLLPDLPGSGKLWLTCANSTELQAKPVGTAVCRSNGRCKLLPSHLESCRSHQMHMP